MDKLELKKNIGNLKDIVSKYKIQLFSFEKGKNKKIRKDAEQEINKLKMYFNSHYDKCKDVLVKKKPELYEDPYFFVDFEIDKDSSVIIKDLEEIYNCMDEKGAE